MYPDHETLIAATQISGEKARKFADANKPRPYSSGKARVKEVIRDLEIFDAEMNKVEEAAGIQSTCKKGCHACCYHSIMASRFDCELILNYIERNYDASTKEAIYARIEQASATLDESMGKAPSTEFELRALFNKQDENKDTYFKLQLACPLLGDQGECMVYPVRPSACWSYRSYGDPVVCETTYDVPHTMVHAGLERYYLMKREETVKAGNSPKYASYHMAGFLPQKLKETKDLMK
jgi:Fe-S-cluster containining protein